MLFHVDRNVKDNLFQIYKKDAIDQVNRKNEMKMRKLNEEREYLDGIYKREQLEEDRRKLDKLTRINNTMSEYKEMLNHQGDPRLKKSKFEDVKINTYGVSTRGGAEYGNNNMQMNNMNMNEMIPNENIPSNNQNYYQQEKTLDKRVTLSPKTNHVKGLVGYENPDFNPGKEGYMNKMHKMEQQKMYKDFLDSQMNQKAPRKNFMREQPDSSALYNNPYNRKNYDFGGSHLNHNPIVNPVNDLQYNKYLFNNLNNAPSNMSNVTPMNYSDNYNRMPQNDYPSYNYNNQINNGYNVPHNDYYQQNNFGVQKESTPLTGERLRMAANNILR